MDNSTNNDVIKEEVLDVTPQTNTINTEPEKENKKKKRSTARFF